MSKLRDNCPGARKCLLRRSKTKYSKSAICGSKPVRSAAAFEPLEQRLLLASTFKFLVSRDWLEPVALSDAIRSATLPAKPTAVAHNQTTTPGTSIPLSSLFTYSAAAGDSIVGFDVEETSNNGGYLTDNGTKQSAGVLYGPGEFGLSIGQIGQWAFVAGPGGTSDMVGFNVDDEFGQFNPTVTASITATLPAKPTATAHNQEVPPGTAIPLSTLFTYSAAAGDSIVGFDVEETSNNGGYLTDNGSKQSAEMLYGSGEFGLPISQIGQWAFVAGSSGVSDMVGFNVDDQYGQFNPTATATVTATLPPPPIAISNNQTVLPSTSIPLTTLFSYSSATGDPIVGFDVEETSNNGGYLTDNGSKQSAGVLYGSSEFGIPISQIGQWAFVAGPGGTSDMIGFNVDDQYGQFNPTVTATVAASLPVPPTAGSSNQTVSPGTSIPLSTLFSYSAASGDSIVGFDVEETSNNGGYLTENGTKEPSGVLYGPGEFGIPIAQIGQWAFVAGPGGTSDMVGFNVDDQYGQFSPTANATITAILPTPPTGIDPNNMGKGDWIHSIPVAEANAGVTTVQGLIDYEKSEGVQWLAVKCGDGNYGIPTNWTQFNSTLIADCHADGIKIFGYVYVYGGGSDPNGPSTVSGEIAVAQNSLALNPDGLIIDWESEYEGLGDSTAVANATQYCQAIRAQYPNTFLATAPIWDPLVNLPDIYRAFNEYCNAVMPQAYCSANATTQTYLYHGSPDQMIPILDADWSEVQNDWISEGYSDAVKPIVPIAYGATPVTGSEIDEFVSDLKNDATPATAVGYGGVSFFDADAHDASIWSAIAGVNIGNPSPDPPSTPSNISPIDGAIGASLTPVITASAFSDPNAGGTQAASEWIIRRSSDNSLVVDTGTDTDDLTSFVAPPLEPSTTYIWQVRYQDNYGAWSNLSAQTSFTTAVAPMLSSYSVNSGAAQRSMVTEATVVFNQPVNLASGAISLVQRGTGGGSPTAITFTQGTSDNTTWNLTFPTYIGGSLPDGIFDLTVTAADVTSVSAPTLAMPSDQTFTFDRLFGDSDGNGIVNNADYFQFKKTYAQSSGSANYNPLFDYDANGIVNNADYFQFKQRYGQQIVISAETTAAPAVGLLGSDSSSNNKITAQVLQN
jgi:hypothetical protein